MAISADSNRYSFVRMSLLSVSYLALGFAVWASDAGAQTASDAPPASDAQTTLTPLPPVVVAGSRVRARRTRGTGAQRAPVVAEPQQKQPDTFDARTGTAGYFSSSTSVATKTNTPLINIPQSVSVVTKDFIKDQAFQNITDVTRYVPGVAVHQGEGNRDELVIRGVDSSANFFVNGFRDDVQYFRDLYNVQSIEVLKGPSALTFGRGAGGGLVNRTLKEADGQRIYEATAQTGSYGDRRISVDAGQAINDTVAVRFNSFYEGSDTFRDYGKLERYGFNPTLTWKPSDDTKIKLSYEYYHDKEVADRGNPSILTSPTATRFNPTTPFAPNGDISKFFGSPTYNNTYADVQTTMAVIDHDFGNGLTVKNSSMYADFNRGYSNVYPGSAANPTTGAFTYSAYNNTTNRENAFNQTDFTYKTATGPVFHTIGFGTEFGRQTGLSLRNTGTVLSPAGNAFDPTYFGGVTFSHLSTDAFSKYRLNIQSAYARDQIEITRWLQLIAGVRYDRFDLTALDENTNISRARVDEKLSPQGAIIVKPLDNLSIYGAYSISYLPASGDQFSAFNNGTVITDPQKFENTEVGVKWNINSRLQYTAALYNLDRTNQPIPDPVRGSPYVLPNGATKVRGFETALTGYVSNEWQATLGYAYTDARIAKDLTPAAALPVVAGNRVQLVPYNQLSLWNKYQINEKWGVGLGIIYFSDSFASSDDTVRLPGFVRVDGGLYYKHDATWSAQLTVQNLFDKGYWASADGNNNLSPGQPRTFRVSATARF
ncbi:MAG TPA: TonB-dependent siderophore receptor [Afipia sp.]